MKIHTYHHPSGAYQGESVAEPDPRKEGRWLMPAFATTVAPPAKQARTWPCWRDDQWTLLPDYRGVPLYRTDTGEPASIDVPGLAPEEAGLTDQAPPGPEYVWRDNAWQVDDARIAAQARAAAMREFDTRMTVARNKTLGRADALVAGLLDDVEVATFKAWAAYQLAVVRVVDAPDFPQSLDWPAEPDEAEILRHVAEAEAEKAAREESGSQASDASQEST